jgi:hypothetical protein
MRLHQQQQALLLLLLRQASLLVLLLLLKQASLLLRALQVNLLLALQANQPLLLALLAKQLPLSANSPRELHIIISGSSRNSSRSSPVSKPLSILLQQQLALPAANGRGQAPPSKALWRNRQPATPKLTTSSSRSSSPGMQHTAATAGVKAGVSRRVAAADHPSAGVSSSSSSSSLLAEAGAQSWAPGV